MTCAGPVANTAAARSIPERFAAQVARAPAALAFADASRRIDYATLDRLSAGVAASVAAAVGAGEPALVWTGDPLWQAVAQLGVLKAGAVCVPLDPRFPAARTSAILEDAGAGIMVCDRHRCAQAQRIARAPVRVLAVDEPRVGEAPGPSLPAPAADALAYVLYTSGSSGTPKGVMQTHRGLAHVADVYARDLLIAAGDRLCAPTPLAYTGTIWALLAALLNGAAFVAVEFDAPVGLLRALRRHRVTVAQLIVSLLRQLLRAGTAPCPPLPDLRLMYTGGEALHREDVQRFACFFPPTCGLICDLGSTEAGIVTHLRVDVDGMRTGRCQQLPGDSSFPVGRPVHGVEVELVDGHGRAVGTGIDGEITVSGPGVSPGYWRDPALTRDRFRRNRRGQRVFLSGDFGRWREDGVLLHRGRRDRQVKIRGYRVDLGEIEAALRALGGVAAAAVVDETAGAGTTRLVAYLEVDARAPGVRALRAELSASIPDYMLPSAFVFVDALPITVNGKLDRGALPSARRLRPDLDTPFVAPRDGSEQAVAAFANELLEVGPVGVNDDLFDIGADSLLMFRLVARVNHAFGADLGLRDAFAAPTVAQLAAAATRRRRG